MSDFVVPDLKSGQGGFKSTQAISQFGAKPSFTQQMLASVNNASQVRPLGVLPSLSSLASPLQTLAEKSVPVAIMSKAKAENRGFWDVFGEQLMSKDQTKQFSVLQTQLKYMDQGHNAVDAKDLALKDHVNGMVSEMVLGTVGEGGAIKPEVDTLTKIAAKKGVQLADDIADKYIGQQLLAREAGATTFTGMVNAARAKVFNIFVDFTAPIERVMNDVFRGSVIPETQNVMSQIDRSLRSSVLGGQFVKDKGFDKVIQNVASLRGQGNLEVQRFNQYLIAKHAATLEEAGIQTGRDIIADQHMISQYKDLYEPHAEKVYQFTHDILDYAQTKGLISSDLAKTLKETYPHYVPVNRIFNPEETTVLDELNRNGGRAIGGLSKQSVVQTIQGSERAIEDPIASLLDKVGTAFQQGEKNEVARTFSSYYKEGEDIGGLAPLRTKEMFEARQVQLAKLEDLAKQREVIGKDFKTTDKTINGMVKESAQLQAEHSAIREEMRAKAADWAPQYQMDNITEKLINKETEVQKFMDKMKAMNPAELIEARITLKSMLEEKASAIAELRTGLNASRPLDKGLTDGSFTFLNDGFKEVWKVNKDIANAMKGLSEHNLDIFTRYIGRPATRLLKLGATGLNLPFVGANIVRDQVTGFLNTENAMSTSKSFFKAMFEAGNHGELYNELVRSGAGGTSWDIGRGAAKDTVDQIVSKRSFGARMKYLLDPVHPIRNAGEMLRAAEDFIGRSEEVGRLQQFYGNKQAFLKAGYSEEEAVAGAARVAREATANFYRRGQVGTIMNSWIPYINAGIQGSRAGIRAFGRDPKLFIGKAGMMVFMPTALTTLWNVSDPERAAIYSQITENEKQRYNIIILPGAHIDANNRVQGVLKLPWPPEVGQLATPLRRGIEQAYGLKPVQMSEIASAMFGTVSPANQGNFVSTVTPQVAKPFMELYANKNFYSGAPIIPQKYQGVMATAQYQKGKTTKTADIIGKATGQSPMKIDYLVGGYGAGVGSEIMGNLDRVLAGLGAIKKDEVGGRSTAQDFSGRFLSAQAGQSDRNLNDAITKAQVKGKTGTLERNTAAQDLFDSLKGMKTSEEKKAAILEAAKKDPQIISKLAGIVQDNQLGLTGTEKRIKSLGVEDGTKARFVYDTMKTMSNADAKAFLINLVQKKVIDAAVLQQMATLKQDPANR